VFINYASRHEDVRGSGGIAQRVVNLVTRFEGCGQIRTPGALPLGKKPYYPEHMRLNGPPKQSGCDGEENDPWPCQQSSSVAIPYTD
jgi:hypothetical protein